MERRGSRSDVQRGVVRRAVQVMVLVAFQALVLFASSGRLRWGMAWVYVGVYVVGGLVNGVLLMRVSPETIAERAESGPGVKDWDKLVGGLFAVAYFVLLLLVAGLDERFGWTDTLPTGAHVAGAATFGMGYALVSWSMVSNAYFSTVVRIQEERGHAVVDTGPYRFVRHPGYVGALLQALMAPLLLGSLWAFIPAAVAAMAMVARTALEDRALRQELAGYSEYAQRVRYRLLPGVW
jgi:protein-S-isoprenylcysteine O-methyltransferase Ste14